MAVAVVQVRKVRMAMHERSMAVAMGVWLARRIVRRVRMLVMRVVNVPVLVLHRFVIMLMLMPLDEMQVKT